MDFRELFSNIKLGRYQMNVQIRVDHSNHMFRYDWTTSFQVRPDHLITSRLRYESVLVRFLVIPFHDMTLYNTVRLKRHIKHYLINGGYMYVKRMFIVNVINRGRKIYLHPNCDELLYKMCTHSSNFRLCKQRISPLGNFSLLTRSIQNVKEK